LMINRGCLKSSETCANRKGSGSAMRHLQKSVQYQTRRITRASCELLRYN
jgi:hypothetical protein